MHNRVTSIQQLGYNIYMATIQKRHNKNGTTSYRVSFRRVGLRPYSRSFSRLIDAIQFAERESEYLFDYDKFMASMPDPLEAKRKREFNI